MINFRNILVGVDLSQGDALVSNELPPPSVEAINRAIWLAKQNAARLRFFYALDVSAVAQRMIEHSEGGEQTLIDKAKSILGELVGRATAEGVDADLEVRFGKSWLEMIRLVMRDDHDLVLAGTRRLGAVKGFLMGSTGLKLLRLCPSPVWVTQPRNDSKIKSVLVAHCLRTVGTLALEHGCAMADVHGAQLHVVHSLEFPKLDTPFPSVVSATTAAEIRAEAEETIQSQLAKYQLTPSPQVHIVADPPDIAIMQHIETFGIELLVMGTIARTGIAGFFTGNTAERLLPQIPCSVLALKPPEFVSPVTT
jgi:universal stress protein E